MPVADVEADDSPRCGDRVRTLLGEALLLLGFEPSPCHCEGCVEFEALHDASNSGNVKAPPLFLARAEFGVPRCIMVRVVGL